MTRASNLSPTSKPGQRFQTFVKVLERALLDNEQAQLESPKRLVDRDTGHLREHDIVITWQQGHHEILTAIECRDTGRPVGVPALEAFSRKCEKTGVHHPVLVSANGFTATALAKAPKLNITCLELRNAEGFPWLGMKFFVEDVQNFGHMDIRVLCVGAMPEGDFTLLDVNGAVVSNEALMATIRNALRLPEERRQQCVEQRVPLSLCVEAPGWQAVDQEGATYRISHFEVATDLMIERSYRPVTLHSYVGPQGRIEVASTEVAVGAFRGHLLMINEEDGTRVLYVPEDRRDS